MKPRRALIRKAAVRDRSDISDGKMLIGLRTSTGRSIKRAMLLSWLRLGELLERHGKIVGEITVILEQDCFIIVPLVIDPSILVGASKEISPRRVHGETFFTQTE